MSTRIIAALGGAALLTLALAIWLALPSAHHRDDVAPAAAPAAPAPIAQRPADAHDDHGPAPDRSPRAAVAAVPAPAAPDAPDDVDATQARVTGVVVDRRGAPVRDATVQVMSAQHENPGRARVMPGQTDDHGRFSITVPPGSGQVWAAAAGFRPQPPGDRAKVELVAGATADVELVLTPSNALRGVVRDGKSGAPIAGARVSGPIGEHNQRDGGTVTDHEGRFELHELPDRIFSVNVGADGYAALEVGGIHGERSRDESVEVELEPVGDGAAPARQFGGIGFQLGKRPDDGALIVGDIFPGTPAAELLQSGDIITRIDGDDVGDMTVRDAAERMRGQIGTNVRIEILRDGARRDVDVERARITRSDDDGGALQRRLPKHGHEHLP